MKFCGNHSSFVFSKTSAITNYLNLNLIYLKQEVSYQTYIFQCMTCINTTVNILFCTKSFLFHIYLGYIYIILCSASPEHYRCNLQWSDDRTLLIGWVDIVRICQIRKRTMQEMINRDLPEFVVDPGNERNTCSKINI